MKLDDLKARLGKAAETASNIQRQMAEAKSLRQEGNVERRTDLYMWPTPEQTLEGQALTAISDLEALVGESGEALKPFADIRMQLPESIKLIQKNVDGMRPITITVTKAQMQTAAATLAKLEKARGKDQEHG